MSQTLWLRLVEHLDQIREPRALPGWIVTTTRNEAFRLLKSRNRTLPVDPLGDWEPYGEDDTGSTCACWKPSATRRCVRDWTRRCANAGSSCCCWLTLPCRTTTSAGNWASPRAASDRPARGVSNNCDARRH